MSALPPQPDSPGLPSRHPLFATDSSAPQLMLTPSLASAMSTTGRNAATQPPALSFTWSPGIWPSSQQQFFDSWQQQQQPAGLSMPSSSSSLSTTTAATTMAATSAKSAAALLPPSPPLPLLNPSEQKFFDGFLDMMADEHEAADNSSHAQTDNADARALSSSLQDADLPSSLSAQSHSFHAWAAHLEQQQQQQQQQHQQQLLRRQLAAASPSAAWPLLPNSTIDGSSLSLSSAFGGLFSTSGGNGLVRSGATESMHAGSPVFLQPIYVPVPVPASAATSLPMLRSHHQHQRAQEIADARHQHSDIAAAATPASRKRTMSAVRNPTQRSRTRSRVDSSTASITIPSAGAAPPGPPTPLLFPHSLLHPGSQSHAASAAADIGSPNVSTSEPGSVTPAFQLVQLPSGEMGLIPLGPSSPTSISMPITPIATAAPTEPNRKDMQPLPSLFGHAPSQATELDMSQSASSLFLTMPQLQHMHSQLQHLRAQSQQLSQPLQGPGLLPDTISKPTEPLSAPPNRRTQSAQDAAAFARASALDDDDDDDEEQHAPPRKRTLSERPPSSASANAAGSVTDAPPKTASTATRRTAASTAAGQRTRKSAAPAASEMAALASEGDEPLTPTSSSAPSGGKRANHIQSEKRRRHTIRMGFQTLVDIVPTLKDTADRVGRAAPSSAAAGRSGKQSAAAGADDAGDEEEQIIGGHTVSKATILLKSVEFIEYLNRRVSKYQSLVDELEAQATSGALSYHVRRPMTSGKVPAGQQPNAAAAQEEDDNDDDDDTYANLTDPDDIAIDGNKCQPTTITSDATASKDMVHLMWPSQSDAAQDHQLASSSFPFHKLGPGQSPTPLLMHQQHPHLHMSHRIPLSYTLPSTSSPSSSSLL
ncbi:hypothetical protein RI367_005312 [Sorochytrium milnesiophthora]